MNGLSITPETALATERTPLIIATEINSIKLQTRTFILQASVEIGRRLVEAKAMVKHGEWGRWLEESVDYSQSTANNLMRIADEYGVLNNTQALGNLSYTQAVALLGVPAEEREQFVEEHDLSAMSTRELQQAIKERDEAQRVLKATQADLARALERNSERSLQAAQQATGRLQEDLEKERQRAKEREDKLLADLDRERSQGKRDEEEYQKLEADLEETQRRLQQLQEQAAQPVTLEPAVVERVPEAITQELNEWKGKAEQLAAMTERYQADESVLRYRVQFEALVKAFRDSLSVLDDMKANAPEDHPRYRDAMTKLINRMLEQLA